MIKQVWWNMIKDSVILATVLGIGIVIGIMYYPSTHTKPVTVVAKNLAKVTKTSNADEAAWEDGAYWSGFAFVFMGARTIADGKDLARAAREDSAGPRRGYWTNFGANTFNYVVPPKVAPAKTYTPFEGAIISGASNGYWGALAQWDRKRGIQFTAPLPFIATNPLGGFTAYIISHMLQVDGGLVTNSPH